MTDTREFIHRLQERTAQAAFGPSSLRNQGAPGVIDAARRAAGRLDLAAFGSCRSSNTFLQSLDQATEAFRDKFPSAGRSWGGARKGVNLFLRDAVYNADLAAHFDLARMRPWLEVPLDKDVATQLIAEREGFELPAWRTIKGLNCCVSAEFQRVASRVAQRKGVARVDLDVFYWRLPGANKATRDS
jgi:hypothetical protein